MPVSDQPVFGRWEHFVRPPSRSSGYCIRRLELSIARVLTDMRLLPTKGSIELSAPKTVWQRFATVHRDQSQKPLEPFERSSAYARSSSPAGPLYPRPIREAPRASR